MNMKHVALDYFPEFKCLADKCNYSCCYQWRIDIKKTDYTKVKNLRTSKETKEKIEHCFKRVRDDSTPFYAHMVMKEDGNCPFLTEQKMCSLQQECGYNVLPEVCKVFPRLKNLAPNTWEHSCSTGCERTVELLLQRPEGLKLVQIPSDREEYMKKEFLQEKLDQMPALHYYKEIQILFMGILQNRKYSMAHRMLLMGLAARDLDKVKTQQEALAFLQKSLPLLQYSTVMEKKLQELQNNTVAGMEIALKPVLKQAILHRDQPCPDRYFLDAIDEVNKNLRVEIQHNKDDSQVHVDLDVEQYFLAQKNFWSLEYTPYFMENLMVNTMIQMQFPLSWGRGIKGVWDAYIDLCMQYNIFKVLVASYMLNKTEIKDLVHIVTLCSRVLAHNKSLRVKLLEDWKECNWDNMAYIAYLVCI